jgi:hypothetical protein
MASLQDDVSWYGWVYQVSERFFEEDEFASACRCGCARRWEVGAVAVGDAVWQRRQG